MQKKRRGGGRETAAWRRGRRDAATVVGRVGRGEVDRQRRPAQVGADRRRRRQMRGRWGGEWIAMGADGSGLLFCLSQSCERPDHLAPGPRARQFERDRTATSRPPGSFS